MLRLSNSSDKSFGIRTTQKELQPPYLKLLNYVLKNDVYKRFSFHKVYTIMTLLFTSELLTFPRNAFFEEMVWV